MNIRWFFSSILSLIIASLIFSGLAQSQSTSPDFATAKAQLKAHLQKALSCVDAATTAEELRQCTPSQPSAKTPPPFPTLPPLPQN